MAILRERLLYRVYSCALANETGDYRPIRQALSSRQIIKTALPVSWRPSLLLKIKCILRSSNVLLLVCLQSDLRKNMSVRICPRFSKKGALRKHVSRGRAPMECCRTGGKMCPENSVQVAIQAKPDTSHKMDQGGAERALRTLARRRALDDSVLISKISGLSTACTSLKTTNATVPNIFKNCGALHQFEHLPTALLF